VTRTKSARTAEDTWAVVTHAVRITRIAEERGQGLLCPTHQARRPRSLVFHDAERLSDRENVFSDYHPAFQVTDAHTERGSHSGAFWRAELPLMMAWAFGRGSLSSDRRL
jgi:hypothetical protein